MARLGRGGGRRARELRGSHDREQPIFDPLDSLKQAWRFLISLAADVSSLRILKWVRKPNFLISNALKKLERVKGIEPSSQAWEARILPLNHTRPRDGFLLRDRVARCKSRNWVGSLSRLAIGESKSDQAAASFAGGRIIGSA